MPEYHPSQRPTLGGHLLVLMQREACALSAPSPQPPTPYSAPPTSCDQGGMQVGSDGPHLLLTSFKLEMRPEEELESPKRFSMVVRLLLK